MAETIGRILKAEREAQGLLVEDVAHALRVPPSRLRDIEDDDFSNFPNPTYARFFFRLYCRHLGVETSEELSLLAGGNLAGLDDYDYLRNEPVPLTPKTPRIRDRMSRWRRAMRVFATTALVLATILAVFSVMMYYTVLRLGEWQEQRAPAQTEEGETAAEEREREARPISAYLPSEVDPEAPETPARTEEAEAAQAAANEAETRDLIEDIENQRSEAEALVETVNLSPEQLEQMEEVVAGPSAVAEDAIAAEAGETPTPEENDAGAQQSGNELPEEIPPPADNP